MTTVAMAAAIIGFALVFLALGFAVGFVWSALDEPDPRMTSTEYARIAYLLTEHAQSQHDTMREVVEKLQRLSADVTSLRGAVWSPIQSIPRDPRP